MKTKMTVMMITMLFLQGTILMVSGPLTTPHTEADPTPHSEADPFVTELIASQTVDVGDVSVWDDGVNLFVKYGTAGDWCLTQTHLQVSSALAEIPQTKKGNPRPGKFEYSIDHVPCTTEYTYALPLEGLILGQAFMVSSAFGTVEGEPGYNPDADINKDGIVDMRDLYICMCACPELYIAAHAVVCGPGEAPMFAQGLIIALPLYAWPEAWVIGTVTTIIEGENLVVTIQTMDDWLLEAAHLYVDPTTPPASPVSWGPFPYSHGSLGEVSNDSFTLSLSDLGVSCGDMLFVSAHASVIKHLDGGVWIERDAWGDENPFDGWLKYFTITLTCKLVCDTAWGDGMDFPGKNWAMYLTYNVQ